MNTLIEVPDNIDLGDDFTLIFNADHSVDIAYEDELVSYDRFTNDGFSFSDNIIEVPESVYQTVDDYEIEINEWEEGN